MDFPNEVWQWAFIAFAFAMITVAFHKIEVLAKALDNKGLQPDDQVPPEQGDFGGRG